MKHIIKRHGFEEHYDSKKVYASVYYASRNAHLPGKESEEIADQVMCEIDKWIENKKEAASRDIFHRVILELKKINKDVAFLYQTHEDIS